MDANESIINYMEHFGFGNPNAPADSQAVAVYVGCGTKFDDLVADTIAVHDCWWEIHNNHIHFGAFLLNRNCNEDED